MTEGDVVRFLHRESDKRRTGVLLRSFGDVFIVVFGTGTRRDQPHVLVRARTRSARALDLYKDTYFYAPQVVAIRSDHLEKIGRCPPGLFVELRGLSAARVGSMLQELAAEEEERLQRLLASSLLLTMEFISRLKASFREAAAVLKPLRSDQASGGAEGHPLMQALEILAQFLPVMLIQKQDASLESPAAREHLVAELWTTAKTLQNACQNLGLSTPTLDKLLSDPLYR
jgi:hypothetical protein